MDNENDNEDDYVNFGDVSRGRLGKQCQYGSQYVDGSCGRGCLGDGLRFKGNTNDYHSLKIHKDDVERFVKRYEYYQKKVVGI